MSTQDPVEMNVQGVRQLVGSGLNKTRGSAGSEDEGVEGEKIDEFALETPDEELLYLSQQWENKYRQYEAAIRIRQEAQKTYYLGRQREPGPYVNGDVPSISANLLFEAEETFLPAALSKNPEPVVWSDDSEEGTKLADAVKTMLQYHADTLVLRRKLTLMVRHWSIYFLGCIKHGWDARIGDIQSDVIDPQKLVLDPDATIDPYGDYTGEYLGERKTTSAAKLAKLFPKHKEFITIVVDGLLGTPVTYTEWWSNEYCFYTFRGRVLDKTKNPHYAYEKVVEEVDEYGEVIQAAMKPNNHFAYPKMPYTFLSVFSLGEQPHDVTGLIEQNIPNQRRITRRTEQIDYNLSRANNSDVFSESNFNQETAKQAAGAMAKGNPILVPQGKPINEAIQRLQAPGIGSDFFVELENSKTDLRSIFGTQGISSQAPDEDQTARGMILNQQFDNSRIGGGIGDAIEQVADNIFNWWVQLYCVYYDEPHFASIMGRMRAVEYQTVKAQDLNMHLVISVSPDSMKPKDEITEVNQAMALYDKGAIGPKTLLTIANFPDPNGAAEDGVLWAVDKNAYIQLNFPELAAKLGELQAQMAQSMAMAGGVPAPAPGGEITPPEGVTEPEPQLSVEPADASLSQVPLPA